MNKRRFALLMLAMVTLIIAPVADAPAQRRRKGKKVTRKIDDIGQRKGRGQVLNWKVGIIVQAFQDCGSIYGTAQVPVDWPEQEVKLIDEKSTGQVRRIRFRDNKNGTRQMMISIPRLSAGQFGRTELTYEITKYAVLPPADTTIYSIPKSVPAHIKIHLSPSPLIESRNATIRRQAKELWENEKKQTDWEQVEVIYDWVRDNVKYKNGGRLKGGLRALRDEYGGYEDLTSLFIALCRASKIPARTVWVPNFCYAEFYLVDKEKKGHWFPCLVAGPKQFGEMNDHRPILQKGDNIKVPEKKKPQRYLAEFTRVRGRGKPRVRFIRRQLQPKKKP